GERQSDRLERKIDHLIALQHKLDKIDSSSEDETNLNVEHNKDEEEEEDPEEDPEEN
ncbi:hypothetical protein FRX31_004517, partial [Thalictrum thalictroides]